MRYAICTNILSEKKPCSVRWNKGKNRDLRKWKNSLSAFSPKGDLIPLLPSPSLTCQLLNPLHLLPKAEWTWGRKRRAQLPGAPPLSTVCSTATKKTCPAEPWGRVQKCHQLKASEKPHKFIDERTVATWKVLKLPLFSPSESSSLLSSTEYSARTSRPLCCCSTLFQTPWCCQVGEAFRYGDATGPPCNRLVATPLFFPGQKVDLTSQLPYS